MAPYGCREDREPCVRVVSPCPCGVTYVCIKRPFGRSWLRVRNRSGDTIDSGALLLLFPEDPRLSGLLDAVGGNGRRRRLAARKRCCVTTGRR